MKVNVHLIKEYNYVNNNFVHTHTHTHSTRAERAYEASTEAESLQEKDKNNSIFVSALKEHLDDGTLNQRLDTLLTDAAAKVSYIAAIHLADELDLVAKIKIANYTWS